MSSENSFSSHQLPNYIQVPGSEIQIAANVTVPKELENVRAEQPEERRNLLDQPPFTWMMFEVPLPEELFSLEDDEDLQKEQRLYIRLLRLAVDFTDKPLSTGNDPQLYSRLTSREIAKVKQLLAPFWQHSDGASLDREVMIQCMQLINALRTFLKSYPYLFEYLQNYWFNAASNSYFDSDGNATSKLLLSQFMIKTYGFYAAERIDAQKKALLVGLAEIFRTQISDALTGNSFPIIRATPAKK